MSTAIPRWFFQFSLAPVALILSLTITGCQKSSSTVDVDTEAEAEAESIQTDGESEVPANSGTPNASTVVPVDTPHPESSTPAADLSIGDPAPPLAIAQWVTGEPVAALEDGHVYVVEFWATWCPPCRTSMPHLSKLQEEYGEKVTFIGVTREDAETVDGFLEKEQSEGKTWRDVVQYRLALDKDDVTNTTYMKAAGQTGIPSAFIVGQDGRIEWIGHPMTMDSPLAKIVSGDWDRNEAIAEAKKEAVLKVLARTLSGLARAEKWDEAIALLDATEAKNGKSQMLTQYRMFVLARAGRTDELAAMESEMVNQVWDNANALNEIAWKIATEGREKPDLKLALKAAKRACELQENLNASSIDTLARVFFEQGDFKAAIEWQKKAAKLNKGAIASIDATLKEYEAAIKKDEPAAPKEEAAPAKEEKSDTKESDSAPAAETSE